MKRFVFTIATGLLVSMLAWVTPVEGKTLDRNLTAKEKEFMQNKFDPFMKDFANKDKRTQDMFIKSIARFGPKTIPAVLKYIDHPNEKVQIAVTKILGKMGSAAHQSTTYLIRSYKVKKSAIVRSHTIKALAKIGAPETIVHKTLLQALEDSSWMVQVPAILAIRNIGEDANNMIQPLMKAFTEGNWKVKTAVALAIVKLEPKVTYPIPVFVEALKSTRSEVRWGSVLALGAIGKKATTVVPKILELFQDKNYRVRAAAARSVGEFGPQADFAVNKLRKLLQDPKWEVRESAVLALGMIGSKARRATDDIVKALEDKHRLVRARAVTALGMMGTPRSIVPKLLRLLNKPTVDYRVKAWIVWAIERSNNPTKEAKLALQRLAKSGHPTVKEEAKEALKYLKIVEARSSKAGFTKDRNDYNYFYDLDERKGESPFYFYDLDEKLKK